MFKFDGTINLALLVTALILANKALSGAIRYYWTGRQSDQKFAERLDQIEKNAEKLEGMVKECLTDKLTDRNRMEVFIEVKNQIILTLEQRIKALEEAIRNQRNAR
jgi:predicted house-cleaning noncanonical NTP pyrophosphatase (MazG superfamily)